MSNRRVESGTFLTERGDVYEAIVVDGICVEDVLMHGIKMSGYKLITGQDKFKLPGKDILDFLIMVGIFAE